MRWMLALVAALLCAVPALASGRVECGSVDPVAPSSRSHDAERYLPRSVGFCALLPPTYDAGPPRKFPVLYFLHGLGEDHTFLVSSGAWTIMEGAQEEKRLPEFVIITPQAGASFYINSLNGRARYEDFFIRSFIPQMEHRFRLLNGRAGRAIGGVSMGGYGALRFAFKYPQMFCAVSVLMPALLQELPQGAGNLNLSRFLGGAFGAPIDEKFWKENTPFVFAGNAKLSGLKIYFATGDRDEYGFDAGARQLDALLTARHVPHTTHIYAGDHSGEFVSEHIEEALQFVASAFALAP